MMEEKAEHLPRMLSLTELSRKVSATIDSLLKGGKDDQIVIVRNNEPAAVMMSAERYERLVSLIKAYELAEDERLAAERMHEAERDDGMSLDEAFAD